MYQEHPIDLIWDESSPMDANVMGILTRAGFSPRSMGAAEVAQYVESNGFGPCVLCMHRRELPDIQMIRTLKQHYGAKIYLVLRVDPSDLESTVEAIKCGVDDVIADGSDQQAKWEKIAGLAKLRLIKNDSYVFVDETSQHLLALVERVGAAEVTALMYGPTGSGKEVLARLTHDFSPRRDGPFVPVNCAALPEALAESLLFGHAKGAFTGATRSTEGFFAQAQGGTLFLDEIGDMPLQMQVKLLRVLQERTFERVGSTATLTADVRIIAATHQDLEALVEAQKFRMDLFYRLDVFPIKTPPLRARASDIAGLITHALSKLPEAEGLSLTDAAIEKLGQYAWPGNVRELLNLVERLTILHAGQVVDVHSLPEKYRFSSDARAASDAALGGAGLPDEGVDLKDHIARMEIKLIQEALDREKGVVAKAAALLGLQRTTLVEKMKKLGIQRD
jgi:sigma-54 specific flagellar transcriptional regulator A